MAFDLGIQLKEEDGVVYEDIEDEWSPVCIPTGDDSMWFETWLKMKERIMASDFRFKNYSWS